MPRNKKNYKEFQETVKVNQYDFEFYEYSLEEASQKMHKAVDDHKVSSFTSK